MSNVTTAAAATAPAGLSTVKLKSITGTFVFGTNDDNSPTMIYVGTESLNLGSFLSPIAATPKAVEAPQPVIVAPPKADALDEKAELLAAHKELFGSNKGMGKASVETLKAKIAAKKGEAKPTTPPAAKVETPKPTTPVAAPKPPAPPAAKAGGKGKPQGQDMPIVNRNVADLNKAIYMTKKNTPMEVYLVEHNTKNNKYKVFAPKKQQPAGLMPGYVAGSEWWADAERISG